MKSNQIIVVMVILMIKINLLETIIDLKGNQLKPLIVIPGLTNSRLSAKLDESVNCYRTKVNKFINVWLNYALFSPFTVKCLIKILTLHPNYSTNKLDYPPGIDFKVPGFGKTYSVEYTDPKIKLGAAKYYRNLVKKVVDLGYQKGRSIRGAPYDFRFAEDQLEDYFVNLKALIEETHLINGKKVVIIAHSLGCLRILQFLDKQFQEWKDEHVEQLILIAAPMGGSLMVLPPLLTGFNYNLFIYKNEKFKTLLQSWPSFYEMLPKKSNYGDSVLIETQSKNFTANDYEELFKWSNCSTCLFNLRRLPVADYKFPRLKVTAINAIGQQTVNGLKFMGNDTKSKMIKLYGDGDGTVGVESFKYCQEWQTKYGNEYEIKCLTLNDTKLNHGSLVTDANSISIILQSAGIE